eukprot:ctg_6657.g531
MAASPSTASPTATAAASTRGRGTTDSSHRPH